MKAYVALFASDGTFVEWFSEDMGDVYTTLVKRFGWPNSVKAGDKGVPA